jgi:hypothetical protein
MIDRYTRVVLTIIAVNLTLIAMSLTVTVSDRLLKTAVPEAWAQNIVPVRVVGGKLDYETDITSGPTLKVCTNC